jgi:hypothetical protein
VWFFLSATWFNYNKEEYFKLYQQGDTSTNDGTKAWFAQGTVASGARMGGGAA